MRHLAQARNPYSLQGLWIPGSRYARPGMTNVNGLPPLRAKPDFLSQFKLFLPVQSPSQK